MTKPKLCIPFHVNYDFNDHEEITEYNIRYNEQENDYMKLVAFIQEEQEKRINIELTHECNLSMIKALYKFHDELYLRINKEMTYLIPQIRELQIKYFLDYTLPAANFTMLFEYMRAGVSDVYICDDLCYDLPLVKDLCEEEGVKLRFILNRIIETDNFNNIPQETSFFARPNDIDLLSAYFDVFEFDFDEGAWNQLEVLYEVYFERKDWKGDLQEIILNLKIPIDNKSLIAEFTHYRIDCRRVCFKGKGCLKCFQFIEIANYLSQQNIAIVKNKKDKTNV